MSTTEFLQVILAGGVGSGCMAVLLAILQRRWKKSDDKSDSIKALVNAQKVLMVDRVRYIGRGYIVSGQITLESKETLYEMYDAYKSLGGNGHLETVMSEVEKLKIVGD